MLKHPATVKTYPRLFVTTRTNTKWFVKFVCRGRRWSADLKNKSRSQVAKFFGYCLCPAKDYSVTSGCLTCCHRRWALNCMWLIISIILGRRLSLWRGDRPLHCSCRNGWSIDWGRCHAFRQLWCLTRWLWEENCKDEVLRSARRHASLNSTTNLPCQPQ